MRKIVIALFPFIPDLPGFYRGTFLALVPVAIVLWILSFLFMASVRFGGDEVFYSNTANTLADTLLLRGISFEILARRLVSFGWFMPGVPIVLLPIYLIFDDPGIAVVRCYASLLTFALWVWAIREVQASLGEKYATALLVFPAMTVTWQFFSATIWADLSAGLLLAILFARVYGLTLRAGDSAPIGLKRLLMLELIMALMVYLRGSTLLVVLALHGFIIGFWLLFRSRALLRDGIGKMGLGLSMFAALLAPWSLTASTVLGDRVLTTSTVPLSLGVTFGNRHELCFGKCEAKNIWYSAARFSRDYAREHGKSELQVQRDMSSHALRNLTFHQYLRQVRRNFKSFTLRPDDFSNRFLNERKDAFDEPETVKKYTEFFTNAVYFPFLLCLLIGNFAIFRRRLSSQVTSLLIKLLTLCLFIQPFVHESHARYWPTFAPLMAFSAALIIASGIAFYRSRRFPAGRSKLPVQAGLPEDASGSRLLTVLQAAYGVVIATVLLAIGFA